MSDFLRDLAPSFAESPAESRRFGLSVARVMVPQHADPATALPWLLDTLASAPHDLVVLRYPAVHATWSSRLLGLGRDIIAADSLVYFSRHLAGQPPIPPFDHASHAGLEITRDRDVDPDALGAMVETTFANFSSHYAANPLLDPADVVAGYREWVEGSIRVDRVLCVSDADGPVAFMTWSDSGPVCELKIGGVHPRAQGRGLFVAVMLASSAAAQKAGCSEIDSPTQVQNLRQLAVSWRSGFRAAGACVTTHVLRSGLLTPGRG